MDHKVTELDDTVIVALEGEIDLECSPAMRKVLLDNLCRGRLMIVDMSGVSLIDSSGVAGLLEAFQEAKKKGRKFGLAAVTEPVMKVFRLARLEKVFLFIEITPGSSF